MRFTPLNPVTSETSTKQMTPLYDRGIRDCYIYKSLPRSDQVGTHPAGHDLTILNRTINVSIMSVVKRLSTFRTAVLHQAAPPPAIGGIVKPPKPNGKAHPIGFETNAPADRAKLALPVIQQATGTARPISPIACEPLARLSSLQTLPLILTTTPIGPIPTLRRASEPLFSQEPTSSGVIPPCGQTILWFISEPSSADSESGSSLKTHWTRKSTTTRPGRTIG